MKQDSEWDFHEALFWWTRYRLIDGSLSNRLEPLMRRRINGKWQYRRPSDTELRVWESINAW